jgi:hypothetical protein
MVDELDGEKRTARVARLVSRLYDAANPALRSRLVACLLRPLGTLGAVGVAAGAFGSFVCRNGTDGARAAMMDMARFSSDQLFELVRFVEQVQPEALQDFASLIAERPMGMAAFSASAALLLMQTLNPPRAGPASAAGSPSGTTSSARSAAG